MIVGWPETTRPTGNMYRIARKLNQPRKIRVASMSKNDLQLRGNLGICVVLQLSWNYIKVTEFPLIQPNSKKTKNIILYPINSKHSDRQVRANYADTDQIELKEQSDQGIQVRTLSFYQHHFDTLLHRKTKLFNFRTVYSLSSGSWQNNKQNLNHQKS